MTYEHRSTWIYLALSTFVAGFILILLFLSMQTVVNEQNKTNLHLKQKTLKFVKPNKTFSNGGTFDKWTIIGDSNLSHLQYSAYFDPRTEIFNSPDNDAENNLYGSVKIFGILSLKLNSEMYCLFRYDNNKTTKIKANEALPIHEHGGKKICAYSIMCPLINFKNLNPVQLPQSVALSYEDNYLTKTFPTFMTIKYPTGNVLAEPNRKLAVCVGPIQSNYNQNLRLVEFIEMYSLLGADKFYFYKVNATNDINSILQYYLKQDIVQNINWNFPKNQSDQLLRNPGMIISFNDCVYRATFIDGFEYVAIVDVDEILMPFDYNTLVELIDEELEDRRTSNFIFREVFYHKYHKNDFFSVPPNIKNRFLYTQSIIERTANPFPARVRSKYIVRARSAIEMGNHHIWRSIDGYTETTVKIEQALLFHYKNKCIFSSCDASLMIDFTARKYGSLIWNRVENVCNEIFSNKNGICPL